MNYTEFVEMVKDQIINYLPDKYADSSISTKKISKNNNISLTGLVIKIPNQEIVPVIYLEEYFTAYENGKPISEVLNDIAKTRVDTIENFETKAGNKILDANHCKDKVFFKLINYEKNVENLAKMPHRIFEDMAIVYRIFTNDLFDKVNDRGFLNSGSISSVAITNDIMKELNLTENDLYELALENTPTFFPLRRIHDYSLNVLSNESLINGATTILYPGVLDTVAKELNNNFFILPSSIHEVLIIEDNGMFTQEELQGMVQGINETEVKDEEVLTNSVYYYDSDIKKISTVATDKQKDDVDTDYEDYE